MGLRTEDTKDTTQKDTPFRVVDGLSIASGTAIFADIGVVEKRSLQALLYSHNSSPIACLD